MRLGSWDRILLALIVTGLVAMVAYAILDLLRH
jgi:hypothetical protein